MIRRIGTFALGAGILALRALRNRNTTSFTNKVVLITGGSRGLGLIMARQLADEGAKLALVARDQEELERASAELTQRGANVLTIAMDLIDRNAGTQAVAQVIKHYGRLDVLINNAGIILTSPLEHLALEDFETEFAIHLWAPLATMRAAVPQMKRQGGGQIVNITSIGGRIAVPHMVPYSASKFALVGLSDGMRAELAQHNIKITTVCPGLMRTGAHYNSLFRGQHEREMAWFSLADSLPFTSISPDRAAQQILDACRHGTPHLTITIQARVLEVLSAVFPNTTARAMMLFNQFLPEPTSEVGDQLRTGWESQSALVPSLLTRLADRETIENNELGGHTPPI